MTNAAATPSALALSLTLALTFLAHATISAAAKPTSCITGTEVCPRGISYCHSDDTCHTLTYERFPTTPSQEGDDTTHHDATAPSPSMNTDVSIILAAGLRFYHGECDAPEAPTCIFSDTDVAEENPSVSAVVLEDVAERQAACVSALVGRVSAVATLVLGDLTDGGKPAHLQSLRDYFLNRVHGLPCANFLSLGVRDYAPHAVRNSAGSGGGMLHALVDMLQSMRGSPLLHAVDIVQSGVKTEVYDAHAKKQIVYRRGSFSYALRISNYMLIVLHDALATTRTRAVHETTSTTYVHDVRPATTWLKEQMRTARRDGHGVVLLPYRLSSLRAAVEKDAQLADGVAHAVIAVVSADAMYDKRADGLWTVPGHDISVPTFVAGSASYEEVSRLVLMRGGQRVAVERFNTNDGEGCQPVGK